MSTPTNFQKYLKQGFIFFIVVFSSCAAFAQCPTSFGIYYWGGQLNGVDSAHIIPTAKKLADSLGVGTIRIALISNDDQVYKKGGPCLTGMNLTALASRPDFNAIITDPQFSTVIITAYDWTSFGDCNTQNFLDSTFYTPSNTAAIELEYTNLANYLKQYTSKKFIISNWEGDNAVYCGAAYYYPNCATAPAGLVGFRKWMMARAAGINAAGAANVKVGIEFCNIHSLETAGKPSVLDNVIPSVYSDYYLYSSYESINVSAVQMSKDIDFIRNKLAGFGKDSSMLMIGEMGFGRSNWGNTAAPDSLQGIINVVKQKRIPYAIAWVLIDSPTNFGAFDSTQVITSLGTIIKNSACQTAPTGIESFKKPISMQLAPNPGKENVELLFSEPLDQEALIEIRNISGQLVYTESLKGAGQQSRLLTFKNYSSGMYFVRVTLSGGSASTLKMIVSP